MFIQIPAHSAQIINRLVQKTYGDVWFTFSEDGRSACGVTTNYYLLSLGGWNTEKRYYIPYQWEDSVFAHMQSATPKLTEQGERVILFGDGQVIDCQTVVSEAADFDFHSARRVIEGAVADKVSKVDFVYNGYNFEIRASAPDEVDGYYIPSMAARNIVSAVSDFLGHEITHCLFYYQKDSGRFCIAGRVADIDFVFVFL